jgi:anti-sigma B factor antagonist
MELEKEINGSRLTIRLGGRLDTNSSPQLDAEIADLTGITELIFDFSGLDYISSSGLRVLLGTQKRMNKTGTMKVIGANETIMEVFDISGFSEIIAIEPKQA